MRNITDYLRVFKNINEGPRITAQGPRNMYAGGQLVTPSVDGSRPGYQGRPKKDITEYPPDVQKLIKDHGVKKYNKLSNNQQYRLRQGEKNVGTGSGRVLGDPITIDGKEYQKVLEGPDKGKYAIKEGTNNPRQFVKKSEIRKTVKANTEKGKQNLKEMYEERSRLYTLSTNNRNKWIKNWIKNNINEYGVREFDNFQTDLLNDFNKELKNNPKKYPEWQGTVRVSDNLPIIGDVYGKNTIVIDGIKFPRYDTSGRTQKHTYKKIFYKNKLKDKNFKAKVNAYLDWNLTRKFEGGAGSMTKTAALDYGKLAKGFDDDVVFFMGEVLNERPLNPGGGQIGIHDIFRDSLGKKGDAYFKKYQGSWGRWTDNFYSVAKLAGLDQSQAKALLQKQINDTQKIMKVYNVKKLPLEFMVAQDHLFGLAEAKALGDPKIAAQTLRNLVASTREQNRYLGQQGFSTKRKALINKFKKAPPNARGPIITELNTLADEFVPGRLKYDVRKDGSLKITNLQPETTLKAKSKAYGEITKTFPKNIQKLINNAKTAKGPGKIKALSALVAMVGAGVAYDLGFNPTEVQAAEAQAGETGVVDKVKSWPIEHPWLTGGAATGAAATTLAGSKLTKADKLKSIRQKIKSGLGKTFRTLGTRAAAGPWAAWTISDNLKKGENIADAVIDPWVGAELMLPNLFKENVSKITKNPWVRNLLKAGKYGRAFTPIGAGITAAGLGIDAYKIARDEYQKMQGMTEQEKSDYLADQYEDLGGVYGEGAAEGGRIGRMGGGMVGIRKPHAIPPERQGLRSIMINVNDD